MAAGGGACSLTTVHCGATRERALAEIPRISRGMFSGVIRHTAEQPRRAWPKLRRVEYL